MGREKVAIPQEDEATEKGRSETSSERVLALLDLFTESEPVWTADALIAKQQVARATMYRYLRALVESGFLAPLGGGAYSLGPRVVEMDRQIRTADPLMQAGPPLMQSISEQVGGAQLLCRFYGLRVISIHDEHTDPRIKSSFTRGRPFPLFVGAPSRIILANLSLQQLQRLFLYHSQDILAAGLGHNWMEFRDRMKAVRLKGYAVASDIDKTLVGVAAPIFVAPDVVTASLCLVRLRKETSDEDIAQLGLLASQTADEISKRLLRPQSKSRTAPAKRPKRASAGE